MPTGTPLLALAPGIVLAARTRDVKKYKCQTDTQMEVYVLHTVGSGAYREEFVAYYAHLSAIDKKIVAGAAVNQGQLLGLSGNTGCSSEPHLHFGISRFTNTAAERLRDHTVPPTEDYDKKTVIDPWGFSWTAKAGFDPWAWRGVGQGVGALSINLWQPFVAPPRD
jgi:murein DD-endopeptidase MepM/ murein hydrolase activator NlpD